MKNVAHSVRDRLLQHAKQKQQTFQFTLIRYGMERFLYRLMRSPHAKSFVLKGGSLFLAWTGESYRVTKDIDLLGMFPLERTMIGAVFSDICAQDTTQIDGLVFDAQTIQITDIKENDKYKGLRIQLRCRLQNARIPIQVDIGFGDAITPEAVHTSFPCLLGGEVRIEKSYPMYTVVSEKLETMVSKGISNSRMKDFYDVWLISRRFELEGRLLQQAVTATFQRRATPIVSAIPLCFTPDFFQEKQKHRQWSAFMKTHQPNPVEPDFAIVMQDIRAFLHPVWRSIVFAEELPACWRCGWR